MEQPRISDKIIRNTIYNIISRFWRILITLFLTPYIIHRIGIERYGIWAIVVALTGYFSILDFGMASSFVKYIAEFYAKKDYKSLNGVVNTGAVFYSIFAILIIGLGFLIINPLLVFLKIPDHLYNEALLVFLLGIMLFGVSNIFSVFWAVQDGLQRMDLTNKVVMAVSIPTVAGTIFFLESGYGLVGLMINSLITIVLSNTINITIAFKILPPLRFNPFLFERGMFKKLFSFGSKLQVSNFAQLVSFQINKLLIAHFLSIGLVTPYQLGSTITGTMRELPLLAVSAVIPAVSEIEVKRGAAALQELYLRGSKYLILVGTPLLFFISFGAPLIILSWVGKGFEKAFLVIQLLGIGYFANTVRGAACSVANGVGRTEFEMRYGIFMFITNLLLGITLIITMGLIGIAIATTISSTFASAYFLWMFHKYLGKPLKDFIVLFYKPIIACLIPSTILYLLNYNTWFDIREFGRLGNLCLLGLSGIFFYIIYLATILFLGYLDKYDKELFGNKFPFLKPVLAVNF